MRRDANTQSGYAGVVVERVLALALEAARTQPCLVGLSGLQGSGKSTLAAQVVAAARREGIEALALSIDDFYLTRNERATLARRVHPLLATRGVPGTHDVTLLLQTLDALRAAGPGRTVRVPRFDKGRDTRLPPSRWPRVGVAPRLVILEGWCVGVPPQAAVALRRPVNRLEREFDPGAVWRGWVNARLAREYVPLWRRLDRLVLLQAPACAVVARWREQAERALRASAAPRAMAPAALRRFLMYYERLSRHALRMLPALADLRIDLDPKRRVRRMVERDRAAIAAAARRRRYRRPAPR